MKKKCKTSYCKNKTKHKYCSTCRSRKCRQRNKYKYAYNCLKSNAKRRGVEFTITFEYFKEFAVEQKLICSTRRTFISPTIHRIDNNKGYIPGNLMSIPLYLNSSIGSSNKKLLSYDWQTHTAKFY